MEYEYNGQLCELTYSRMMRAGAFGDPNNIPPSLSGKEARFEFESPLHDAIEQKKGQQFLEAKQLIAEAASIDGTTLASIDAKKAIRDALHGVGVPAEWIRSQPEMDQIEANEREKMAEQERLDQMEQSAEISATLAKTKEGMNAA
jgi:hypothetical protein